jgi:predicted transcriptional regulator
MSMGSLDPYDLEDAKIDQIISDRTPPVRVTTPIPELWDRMLDQNFVPVVDDRDMFMGIVTRRSVMAYLMNRKGNVRTGDGMSS